MSEHINEIMEKMVPSLQDMEDNQIFSHEEIASIIRKRRNMEYAISSYTKKIEDFIVAIEYEINLETLRKMRKRRLGIDKPLISDYSIQSRIIFIFERMVKRYVNNLDVWMRYVEYCESTNNNSKLSSLYPRILQLHPRAESIWVRAANWEMSIGNITNARTFLQRGLRINHSSVLLWKEYFRFELAYINLIEERRRVLGLSTLKEELKIDSDDETMKVSEQIEKEIQKDETLEELPASFEEEPTSKTEEIDNMITQETEEIQAQFLRGSIPKVVYKNAMKELANPQLALSFLEISYQLNNTFVEKFILDDILQNYGNEISIWRNLLAYPVSRIASYLNSNDEDIVKRHKEDVSESTAACAGLAEIACSRLGATEGISKDQIYSTVIGGLSDCYKVLRVADAENSLKTDIEKYIEKCTTEGILTPAVIKEIISFYAMNGDIQKCMEIIKANEELLEQDISYFDYVLVIFVSMYNRSPDILKMVMDWEDPAKGIITRFQRGLQTFQNTKEKEALLKLHVRYLKFLISVNQDEKLINKAFKTAFEVCPELNSSVFLLYLSWSNEKGIEKAREAIDFAFMNEVLIPLDEELLNECIDIEKRHMAGLTESESKEKEKTILHCEKIYDNYCKRYSKKCDVWIEYLQFERSYNRFTQMQRIYNRGLHSVDDVASFEEKYNLLQTKGHL